MPVGGMSAGLRRRLPELNPLWWPLGAMVLALDVARPQPKAGPATYAYTRSRVPDGCVLDSIIRWLYRAQDATPDGGVSAYLSLYGGFARSYPETTGYIVPTWLEYSNLSGASEPRDRALRAVDWLATLQLDSGAYPGGYGGPQDGPSVFNTGQIVFGLVAAWRSTQDTRYLESAARAGDWLRSVQSSDGAWRSNTYAGGVHVYYTMVAWALAELSRATGEEQYGESAVANCLWAASQQGDRGWPGRSGLEPLPFYLHFVAYTLQGLLAVGRLLGDERPSHAALPAAEYLMRQWELRKRLAGAYAEGWVPLGKYACLTGIAQMALVWMEVSSWQGDMRFLNASLKANEYLKSHVRLRGPACIRGAVKGSQPVWGSYLALRYPNWAAKFTADALMKASQLLVAISEDTEPCA